jgi:membrane associated rhomboid family serine protease
VDRTQSYRKMQFGLMWTPAVKWLIIINSGIYIAQELLPIHTWNIFDWVGLVPWAIWHDGWVWQLVTYMFFHGGIWHLVFNMLALWMFGSMMERTWGTKRFLRYYFLTGIGAGLSTFLFTLNSTTPTIGASGAIYGLLVAYAVTFPEHTIYLYFFIPIKAKYFALLFGLIEFIASISYSGDSIGHIAHLGGMVVGFVYLKRQKLWMGIETRLRKSLDHLQEQRRQREEHETENVRQQIDQILDKINRVGYQNLTRKERKILDQGSSHLRQKEKAR